MRSKVIRKEEAELTKTEWGSLQWMAGSHTPAYGMTLGRVTFKPGMGNPTHQHPECEEILYVIEGEIEHTLPEGGVAVLKVGDAILIPRGEYHKAKNIGQSDAVVVVAFNSEQRSTVTRVSGAGV